MFCVLFHRPPALRRGLFVCLEQATAIDGDVDDFLALAVSFARCLADAYKAFVFWPAEQPSQQTSSTATSRSICTPPGSSDNDVVASIRAHKTLCSLVP